MSEFMGLIMVEYDAKSGGGFRAAGASLHNVMSAHGPDSDTQAKASNMELKPTKVGDGSMAFMFESPLMMGVTDWGLETCNKVQEHYNEESWVPLKRRYRSKTRLLRSLRVGIDDQKCQLAKVHLITF
ncbi:Homogentisate 1,2-dioxygenase [Metarhizium guizhouense ARSEF 977]|uniref:homogentisate 1,2-dioxygenase n=1 Tax=Metarhizium guizhouense (strain ARSEF 977) TaxID=1276136 RepID=A0A0B4H1J6_METGA|nr:Homogentisate 1,2-dioxygenase [Metarhizium guizhouense ARSEF 977]